MSRQVAAGPEIELAPAWSQHLGLSLQMTLGADIDLACGRKVTWVDDGGVDLTLDRVQTGTAHIDMCGAWTMAALARDSVRQRQGETGCPLRLEIKDVIVATRTTSIDPMRETFVLHLVKWGQIPTALVGVPLDRQQAQEPVHLVDVPLSSSRVSRMKKRSPSR
jgi:hypothetical protein